MSEYQWGYGQDFIDLVNNKTAQEFAVPIKVFDQIVADYLKKREQFVMNKTLEGSIFDDAEGFDPGF
jgi:hypothetical protein